MRLLIIVLSCMVILSCSSSDDEEQNEKNEDDISTVWNEGITNVEEYVSFERIELSHYGYSPNQLLDPVYHVSEETLFVIENEPTFQIFLSDYFVHTQSSSDIQELNVDFNNKMVIAVIGQSHGSEGNTLEIADMYLSNQKLIVKVKKIIPGNDCTVTEEAIGDSGLVILDKTDKEPTISLTEKINNCDEHAMWDIPPIPTIPTIPSLDTDPPDASIQLEKIYNLEMRMQVCNVCTPYETETLSKAELSEAKDDILRSFDQDEIIFIEYDHNTIVFHAINELRYNNFSEKISITNYSLRNVYFRDIIDLSTQNEPLEDSIYSCEETSDCMSVRAGYCDCAHMGKATSINRNYFIYWQSLFTDSNTLCPAMISNDPTCFAEPKCVMGRCELITND